MMSKHPLDLSSPRKLSREEILEALRLSIIAELDAINLYLQLARSIEDEKVRKVFEEVAREEKTHVGEFLTVLKELDFQQAEELEKGASEVAELTGLIAPKTRVGNTQESPKSNIEALVAGKVKEVLRDARTIVKKLPTSIVGRRVSVVEYEKLKEGRLERAIVNLRELSQRFRVSQHSLDYASGLGLSPEFPEAVKTALWLASEEEKLIVEALIREAGITIHMGDWEDPNEPVLDVARAVSELASRGYRGPTLLLTNPSRYTRLLKVLDKAGLSSLERVKALVEDVLYTPFLPDDVALILSSTPEVIDVVYGSDGEVEYIGPEDGYHVFRLWSSIGLRIKSSEGVVLLSAEKS